MQDFWTDLTNSVDVFSMGEVLHGNTRYNNMTRTSGGFVYAWHIGSSHANTSCSTLPVHTSSHSIALVWIELYMHAPTCNLLSPHRTRGSVFHHRSYRHNDVFVMCVCRAMPQYLQKGEDGRRPMDSLLNFPIYYKLTDVFAAQKDMRM